MPPQSEQQLREQRCRYISEIQSMMYTFGDVRVPLSDTAQLMEQLVHKQLIDIIIQAARVAQGVRRARSLLVEDIIFVVRHDPLKLTRLREFLTWKEVRKNGNKTDGDVSSAGVGGGGSLSIALDEDIECGEVDDEDDPISSVFAAGLDEDYSTANACDNQMIGDFKIDDFEAVQKSIRSAFSSTGKRKNMRMPWDVVALLVAEGTGHRVDLWDSDQMHPDVKTAITRRLGHADRITRNMSRDEYMEFSECRQASFTYKKPKKFRDWLNAAQYIDYRLSEEHVEVLGFLAWEMVRLFTEAALAVRNKRQQQQIVLEDDLETANADLNQDLDQMDCQLFISASERTAILPEDLLDAIAEMDYTRTCNYYSSLLSVPRRHRRLKLY